MLPAKLLRPSTGVKLDNAREKKPPRSCGDKRDRAQTPPLGASLSANHLARGGAATVDRPIATQGEEVSMHNPKVVGRRGSYQTGKVRRVGTYSVPLGEKKHKRRTQAEGKCAHSGVLRIPACKVFSSE